MARYVPPAGVFSDKMKQGSELDGFACTFGSVRMICMGVDCVVVVMVMTMGVMVIVV